MGWFDYINRRVNPIYALGKISQGDYEKGKSRDQQFGAYMDPAGFFGKKEHTSFSGGPNRLELNKQRFYDTAPKNAPIMDQSRSFSDNPYQMQSSYSGMLGRK